MAKTKITSLVCELHEDATDAEALAWIVRMRRFINRWDRLPGTRPMTPAVRRDALDELDELEYAVHEYMAPIESV
jgi:hypothetical protein